MECDDIYEALKAKANGRMTKSEFREYAKSQRLDDCRWNGKNLYVKDVEGNLKFHNIINLLCVHLVLH